jgi:hypothetical protein
MAGVGIYYWKDKLLIPNNARTTEGVGIDIAPVDIINARDKEALINIISDRMHKKDVVIPHPKQNEWNNIPHACSQAVGYKSWRKFDREIKLNIGIGIREKDCIFTKFHKPISGYEWAATKEDEQIIKSKDPEVLAEYVMKEIEEVDSGE